MKIYLATNETPKKWMLCPNDNNVNDPEESTKRIFELDKLHVVPFVWVKKKFLPLRAYKKGNKPQIQDFDFIIRWEI